MRDNASRFQRRLSELLVTALGCSNNMTRLIDGNIARLDRNKRKNFFSAEVLKLHFVKVCIITHLNMTSGVSLAIIFM